MEGPTDVSGPEIRRQGDRHCLCDKGRVELRGCFLGAAFGSQPVLFSERRADQGGKV